MKRRQNEQQCLFSCEQKWNFLLDLCRQTIVSTENQLQRSRQGYKTRIGLQCEKPITDQDEQQPTTLHILSGDDAREDEDPFDCSSLAFPPTYEMVDEIANEFVARWKQLDERRVDRHSVISSTPNNDEANKNIDAIEGDNYNLYPIDRSSYRYSKRIKRARIDGNQKKSSWFRRHVRLPSGFELTTNASGDDEEYDQKDESLSKSNFDCVVSLLDPGELLLYSSELRNLFQYIPTVVEDLEPLISLNMSRTKIVNKPKNCRGFAEADDQKMKNMFRIIKLTLEGSSSLNILDNFDWSRIRALDRHSSDWSTIRALYGAKIHDFDGPSNFVRSLASCTEKSGTRSGAMKGNLSASFISTIRFECHLKKMKRGSSPDPFKMVLEFGGYQTLLDVHKSIAELSDDTAWDDMIALQSSYLSGVLDITKPRPQCFPSSGYFFIEDTFYVTGSVDYISPIFQWLYEGLSNHECVRRAAQLGLDCNLIAKLIDSQREFGNPLKDDNNSNIVTVHKQSRPTLFYPTVKPMNKTLLCDLPIRLLVRYVHVHNGDVECSLFVTDHKVIPACGQTILPSQLFPIIHDVYTASNNIPDCEVCQNRPAAVVTSTAAWEKRFRRKRVSQTKKSTNIGLFGHHFLCECCARMLKLPDKMKGEVQRYCVWRPQIDLSMGWASSKAF